MLHTKAFYNLLRLKFKEDPSLNYEAWAVEDLRGVSLEELFARLAENQIGIDKAAFFSYAEECDTPEELFELLDGGKENEKVYLTLFELWRRLLPEKQSISLFCDELDRRIEYFDEDLLESDEPIQDALANLEEILEENIDLGADPKDVFQGLLEYLAHDLEGFLYDYISEILDQGNSLYASELIDGFSQYVSDRDWFEFLRARLFSFSDIAASNLQISNLLESNLDLSLLLEILRFLASTGDRSLFVEAAKKASSLIETQGEFQEVLSIASEYYRRLDLDPLERAVQKLLNRHKDPKELFDPNAPEAKAFSEIISE